MLLALILSFAAAVIADILDVQMTVSGIRSGVAVEGNTWLVGPKPTGQKLYVRDLTIIALIALLGISAFRYHHSAGWGVVAMLTVATIKHVQGAVAWARLIK